jgi:hypothetical protein
MATVPPGIAEFVWPKHGASRRAGTSADTARPEIPHIIQHLNIFRFSNRHGTRNNLVASNPTSPQGVYA